jgi:RimJ/RimL family protein N-acetyltransferase
VAKQEGNNDMKSVTSLLKTVWAQLYFTAVLLKIGGLKVFLKQFLHQIYSNSSQVSFTLDLQDAEIPQVEAKIKYSLQIASKQDMDEIMQKAKSESKDMAQKLVYRRWLYEDGYRNCYIARTADTNEMCFIQFIIYPQDDKIVNGRFKSWFPKLKEDEAFLEGTYTFEKFRGNRLHPSVTTDQLKICKEQGFKRVVAYTEKKNEASLKGAERAGFKPIGEVPERKILFFTKRRFNRVN